MSDHAEQDIRKRVERINRELDACGDVKTQVEKDGGKCPEPIFDPMRYRFDVLPASEVPVRYHGGYSPAPDDYVCFHLGVWGAG